MSTDEDASKPNCKILLENNNMTSGSLLESRIEELVQNGTISECVILHCHSRIILTCGEVSILTEILKNPRSSIPIMSVLTADLEDAIDCCVPSICPSSFSFGVSKHHVIWKSLRSLCAVSER